MRYATEAEKQTLWDEVRREFPDDPMMQEVHFARLIHRLETEGMTAEEQARYYADQAGLAQA